jgi:hypothetical protein
MGVTKGVIETECMFFDKKRKECRALKALYCKLEDKPCSFFKLRESAENSKNKTR